MAKAHQVGQFSPVVSKRDGQSVRVRARASGPGPSEQADARSGGLHAHMHAQGREMVHVYARIWARGGVPGETCFQGNAIGVVDVLHRSRLSHSTAIDSCDRCAHPALHLLCRSPTLNRFSVDCARQLMLANKSVHEMTDKKGKVPLHALCAAMTQHRQGMEFAEVCVQGVASCVRADACCASIFGTAGRSPLCQFFDVSTPLTPGQLGAGDIRHVALVGYECPGGY
jgi:hypothetical protein